MINRICSFYVCMNPQQSVVAARIAVPINDPSSVHDVISYLGNTDAAVLPTSICSLSCLVRRRESALMMNYVFEGFSKLRLDLHVFFSVLPCLPYSLATLSQRLSDHEVPPWHVASSRGDRSLVCRGGTSHQEDQPWFESLVSHQEDQTSWRYPGLRNFDYSGDKPNETRLNTSANFRPGH